MLGIGIAEFVVLDEFVARGRYMQYCEEPQVVCVWR